MCFNRKLSQSVWSELTVSVPKLSPLGVITVFFRDIERFLTCSCDNLKGSVASWYIKFGTRGGSDWLAWQLGPWHGVWSNTELDPSFVNSSWFSLTKPEPKVRAFYRRDQAQIWFHVSQTPHGVSSAVKGFRISWLLILITSGGQVLRGLKNNRLLSDLNHKITTGQNNSADRIFIRELIQSDSTFLSLLSAI